jgi:hypothetical protein
MCISCKHILCICKRLKKGEKPKLEYMSAELRENAQDFFYVKGILEQQLGISVSKVDVFKHCLIIALRHYNNGKGVL